MNDVMMPAGKYYIGDLCYVMQDEWGEMCRLFFANRNDHSCNEGKFQLADGRTYACFNTAHGDGEYYDSKRLYSFSVDSGSIGCILVSDLREPVSDLGAVVEFKEPFHCSNEGGVIKFGTVAINTDDWEPEEDEYEEDEE